MMSKQDLATKDLVEAGAVRQRAENRHGETLTGWWLDGVYLGKTATDAIEALRG